ncbi:unnamed protein product [Natator depressus]
MKRSLQGENRNGICSQWNGGNWIACLFPKLCTDMSTHLLNICTEKEVKESKYSLWDSRFTLFEESFIKNKELSLLEYGAGKKGSPIKLAHGGALILKYPMTQQNF